ncbi:MAG TPA: MG2 domain-containing protein [Rectinemataceae bacterium]|nr:MG2 domain-containing protein [Rectinemataceae bacterium]
MKSIYRPKAEENDMTIGNISSRSLKAGGKPGRRTHSIAARAGLFAAFVLLASVAWSQAAPPAEKLLPERYLREYDPVTVFFAEDRGPKNGGPGDDASSVLSISPAMPGEYRWLDARTLQFLPAQAWPALRSFAFTTKSGSYQRSTLMTPPIEVSPAPSSTNLPAFEGLTLSFAAPLPADAVADMLSFEVRPLPGLGSQASTILTRRDFSLKELERSDSKAPVRYRLTLDKAVGDGKSVRANIKLSLDQGIPGSVASYSWTTRTDFRVLAFGSGPTTYPVSSSGSNYPSDQAIFAGTSQAPLFVVFSEAPSSDTPVALWKSMVSFEPAVRNLRFELSGNRLLVEFDRDADTDYTMRLSPASLESASGRGLSPFAASSFHFFNKALEPYVQWSAGQAILERYGPQSLPMEARGIDKVDLRVYRIDPLDPDFWPFPEGSLKVDEASPPPMPGEEPPAGEDLAKQIRLLGSPPFSGIASLPMKATGSRASFGLDLAPALAKMGMQGKPGTYLVGYRRLGAGGARDFVRVQVTDLCLTVVEETRGLLFTVTSLSTAKPIAGALVRLESRRQDPAGDISYDNLLSGTTDADGGFHYDHVKALDAQASRVSVSFGDDVLVIDPDQAPPYFHNNHWFGSNSGWLSWLTMEPEFKVDAPRNLAYVFTERPLYRAEEAVHIQGFVRLRDKGLIKADDPKSRRVLVVSSPDGSDYRYPVSILGNGYFYQKFDEKNLPTGEYRVQLLGPKDELLASMSFRKEAYRVPTFEIDFTGPDKVPFDAPFQILMTANYYSGGKVAGQKVDWSVAEGVWTISPAAYPDYLFSSYLSVGGEYREEGVSASQTEDVTDDEGSARITIDPRTAESISPRFYRVQASVRGADAQTVSQSRTVYALPPFAIGLKLGRFETERMAVKPSIIVVDHEEKPLAGKDLVLKLYERQWHSYLSESDISTGQTKYVSDVVDVPVLEKALVSAATPLDLDLPVGEAGVYIVEIQGRDALGRLQSVKRDLYVAGPTPLAWKRTTAAVFETSLDADMYKPGDTARVLLKSPFQQAEALAVVERPSGNLYKWVDVKDGQGLLEIPVTAELVPRFPVHLVLMRGRLPGDPSFTGGQDRLRPLSVANTTWVAVDPATNRLAVSLEHAPTAVPGSNLPMKIYVKDSQGRPVDGEVALWLVDRAVLALGKERFASPLSSFITDVKASVRISDTRNLAVGNLPFDELSGGDMAEEFGFGALLDKTSVRKNFKTVPYYEPAIEVVNGVAEVNIPLPDNLTEFAVRAIATSGYDTFGTARSLVAMRLPVMVQESLPRFIRPGDKVVAGGIGRVAEGPGGPAQAELKLEGGLVLEGGKTGDLSRVQLDQRLPTKLLYSMTAPPELASKADSSTTVSLGLARLSDGARDAFSLDLPIRRDTITQRLEISWVPEGRKEYSFPMPAGGARAGSTVQTLYVVSQPELLAVLKALRFQASYPYGCTEQRIAKVHAVLALGAAMGATGLPDDYKVPEASMRTIFSWLDTVIDGNGLYSFYPGSSGSVALTSYVVEFLALAKKAGYTIPAKLLDLPTKALKDALRSDYDHFAAGYSLLERGMALVALDAVGAYDPAYGQTLLALSQDADLYSQARIWLTLDGKKGVNAGQLRKLRDRIGEQLVFQKLGGGLVLSGLQGKRSWFGNPFLYSDWRSVAAIYAVYARDRPGKPETQAILNYLISGSGYAGWGDTYTNTSVLLSLVEAFSAMRGSAWAAEFWDGSSWKTLDGKGRFIAKLSIPSEASLKVRMRSFDAKRPPTLLLETSYVPAALGSELRGSSSGFVVSRELLDYGAGKGLVARWPVRAGTAIPLAAETVVEDHVTVVNPEARSFVAVRVPLAAGFEPLNPNLATSPEEAKPAGSDSLEAAWSDFEDDQVTFYFTDLPAGSFDFYFRERANFAGSFSLPPATAQVLYQLGLQGTSDGAPVAIEAAAK